jgi:pantetheine-phosphate adenylyltransferase
MRKKYLFAGSFNPYTIGHASVLKNASTLLPDSELHVGITQNPNKADQNVHRLKWITNGAFSGLDSQNVKIVPPGLLANYAKDNEYLGLIRSLRNSIDLIQEVDLATWNNTFGMSTMFVPSDSGLDHVSSSAIRELTSLNQPMRDYFLSDVHYKRFTNKLPARIIVTGKIGSGKSSFIDYISRCDWHRGFSSVDMDAVVKDNITMGASEKFKTFFDETNVDDIVTRWNSDEMKAPKAEVESIITNANLNCDIVEISALTAYDVKFLYSNSIIVYVGNFENGKNRTINEEFKQKTLKLNNTPDYVDFVVTNDNADEVIKNMFMTLRGC